MSEEKNTDAPGKRWGGLERFIETFLWRFRLVIMLGVVGLLISSLVVFIVGSLSTFHLVYLLVDSILHHGLHLETATYNKMIVEVITIIDDFLLGIVLMIFGLGTYDLFISRIDPATEQDDVRPHWLVFNSMEELKSVLGKVVLMILTINFLRLVVETPDGFTKASDLTYLGVAILCVSGALWLSHGKDIDASHHKPKE